MIYIANKTTQIEQPAPFPPLRNLKRNFIFCNFRQGFFPFDLAFGNEALFLGLNLLIEFFAGAFFGALLDEFTLNCHLQKGFLHIAGEALIERFQLVPCLFVAVDIREKFFDFGDDAALFRKRGKRKKTRRQIVFMNSLLSRRSCKRFYTVINEKL